MSQLCASEWLGVQSAKNQSSLNVDVGLSYSISCEEKMGPRWRQGLSPREIEGLDLLYHVIDVADVAWMHDSGQLARCGSNIFARSHPDHSV